MQLDLRRHAPLLVALWCVALTAAVIALRPLTPVDETRYASVAWEMWRSGDWLQLRLNGELYGDKPPLLFWLINAGWTIFGVSDWWPRVLTASFAAGALGLTWRLARRLAPSRPEVAPIAVFITGSGLYWTLFTGALMFDAMLSFFVLLGVLGVARAATGGRWANWIGVGVAIGLGILTKGPVALLHVLPLALLAPWWTAAMARPAGVSPGWGRWYGGVAIAVLLGAAIALAWAVPAALASGAAFGREIFWNQSVDRMATTTHHLKAAWFYLAALPVLLFPWLFVPSVWKGLAGLGRAPAALVTRFALAWAVPVLLAFSAFKGKQAQYLLPETACFALLAGAALATLNRARASSLTVDRLVVAGVLFALSVVIAILMYQPRFAHVIQAGERSAIVLTIVVIGAIVLMLALVRVSSQLASTALLGTASVLALLGSYAGIGRALFDSYDVRPVAQYLAQVQAAGRPIANVCKYHGQFQFVGRLQEPLHVIRQAREALEWAQANPGGAVVLYSYRPLSHPDAKPEFVQGFKGHEVYVWRAADLRGVSDSWYTDRLADDGSDGC
ncbi:MAG: glycosyltransferase family 39 protein [Burkholderiales bacterium]|nr:MAG: glycosyltransferase family 39 protein [Burkholderiales bacterium]